VRPIFETVRDLSASTAAIRARRYGVIETTDGRFDQLRLRPWPKVATLADVAWFGRWYHGRAEGDRCRLYYNQPWGHRQFLALKYVVSTRDCTLATLRAALKVLDEIARLKGIDAVLTDASNQRISDRLLARGGWQSHCPSSWHRHYIKRYYGNYPPPLAALR
jgi:hypothetical protein